MEEIVDTCVVFYEDYMEAFGIPRGEWDSTDCSVAREALEQSLGGGATNIDDSIGAAAFCASWGGVMAGADL